MSLRFKSRNMVFFRRETLFYSCSAIFDIDRVCVAEKSNSDVQSVTRVASYIALGCHDDRVAPKIVQTIL